jgi:hypothetical protein
MSEYFWSDSFSIKMSLIPLYIIHISVIQNGPMPDPLFRLEVWSRLAYHDYHWRRPAHLNQVHPAPCTRAREVCIYL